MLNVIQVKREEGINPGVDSNIPPQTLLHGMLSRDHLGCLHMHPNLVCVCMICIDHSRALLFEANFSFYSQNTVKMNWDHHILLCLIFILTPGGSTFNNRKKQRNIMSCSDNPRSLPLFFLRCWLTTESHIFFRLLVSKSNILTGIFLKERRVSHFPPLSFVLVFEAWSLAGQNSPHLEEQSLPGSKTWQEATWKSSSGNLQAVSAPAALCSTGAGELALVSPVRTWGGGRQGNIVRLSHRRVQIRESVK